MRQCIGFAPDLVPLIISGQKTLTYRLGTKYDFLKIGDIVDLADSSTGLIFASANIRQKTSTKFKYLAVDNEGYEKYSSKDEQRRILEGYYNCTIQENDEFLVIGFEVFVII